MAESVATLTVIDSGQDNRLHHVVGTLAIAAGDYSTGGIACSLKSLVAIPGIASDPIFARFEGISGYIYEYDKANSKLIIRQGNAVAAHTHDLKFIGGITATEPVAIDGGDTLGKNAATDRTIAGATSATKGGVVSGGSAAAAVNAELAASAMPAAVVADTITVHAIFRKNR